MTRQEIFKEYSESNTKSNCVNKLSKRLGVPKSTIICELFKSGFKYRELERSMKNDYAAAEKKYQEWLDAGKPESEIVEKEEETTAMSEVTEAMKNLAESAENLAKLKADNIKLIEDMEKTEKINQGLLVEIEELKKKYDESISVTEKYVERIRGLESEVEEAIAEKTRADEVCNENMRYLQIRERELAEVRAELEAISAAEKNESDECLEGMDEEINNVVAELSKVKMKNSQLAADLDTTTGMYLKERKKRKKLEKAFLKLVTK